jgi:DNA (cytosine-5)-methyltransferase 1
VLTLDLYSGAGGAGMGYARAGHDVIGVDITPQPNYPFTFWRTDALHLLQRLIDGERFALKGQAPVGLADIGFIHASPPCQLYTAGNRAHPRNPHPDLVAPTRELLEQTGLPYVIENVEGAPLIDPTLLCGRMFDLGATDTDGEWVTLNRHRIFETNWHVSPPTTCRPHKRDTQVAGVYGGARRDKWDARHIRHGGYVPAELSVLRELMGIDWMSERELFLAIPPKYTEWIAAKWGKTVSL